ncbi:hypothetical protein ACFWZ2_12415 [Streptomyces sp. NPDC059002]|uniref:hypothetical protein n=1 Tax=Streptomyces sp. NPDC059002 TaxID=3346690 RepID=UPI0036945285
MSSIARFAERHTTTVVWLIILGGAGSAFFGDHLWRWTAGLGPGAGYAFGAFCGSGILCSWPLAAAAARRRQWVRFTGAAAVAVVAFLAVAGLPPGRRGRPVGALAMPDDQRMWVEEHPTVWWAIGVGLACGAFALWGLPPLRRATGRWRSGSADGPSKRP